MKLTKSLCNALVLVFSLAFTFTAQAFQESNPACEYGTTTPSPDAPDLRIVSTFHSMSVYWSPRQAAESRIAHVTFKALGSSDEPQRSLDMVYADGEYRGSIVHLKSGTEYEIGLWLREHEREIEREIEITIAETWCEQFPIAETVVIPSGVQAAPYQIRDVVGSPDGYILYTADGVLDGQNVVNNVVIQSSSYIILRGLNLVNAQQHAISIKGHPTHDILIEKNTIENWGRVSPISGFGESDNAISTENGGGRTFERLIAQRNVIRNPRADTNSWAEFREDQSNCTIDRCHPKGPGGVFFKNTTGNHVIRYNEIYSTNRNYFFDGIGGADDFSSTGAFSRDTDIYGNIVTNVWDDAIESEGGNMNVRIWGNYIDNVRNSFATAIIATGPLYIFRNVVYRTQADQDASDNSGTFIKTQVKRSGGGGPAFVFHNTVFRHDGMGGVDNGISGTGTPLVNFTSRNIIIEAANHFLVGKSFQTSVGNDFDYDLYQGDFKKVTGQEANGIQEPAEYDPIRPMDYVLADGALGHDDGDPVPNFSMTALPDMGAQERGVELLQFGVSAYLSPSEPLPGCS